MQDGLKKMPDLHRLCVRSGLHLRRLQLDAGFSSKRFKKGVASLQDVVRVYQAILELPTFVEGITGAAEDNERLHGLYLEVYGNPFRVRGHVVRRTLALELERGAEIGREPQAVQ
jgi:DNA mismatch repair protein MSH2